MHDLKIINVNNTKISTLLQNTYINTSMNLYSNNTKIDSLIIILRDCNYSAILYVIVK